MSLTDEDKQWITERLEAVETKILTAFHKFAEITTARQRSHTEALQVCDLEIEALKHRVAALEGRR
ncbi:MAG TPA: hypothetical protein VKU19_39460 [Bryobacteraceae bacterium]|nr:hypothetical protein [Bryobacteraceae bacterium]